MSEEILDIVDEMDLVIGSATRGEVHSSGLLHRCLLYTSPSPRD